MGKENPWKDPPACATIIGVKEKGGITMKRDLALLFLVLLIALCALTGCSKDALVAGYSQGLAWIGDLPLQSESRLCGERDFGPDHYTGGYRAEYEAETGTEFLFGGTSLEARTDLRVQCEIEPGQGEARLCLQEPEGDVQVLCEAGETCDETLDLPAGSNYLYMELNGYTGVAALTVEDAAEEP